MASARDFSKKSQHEVGPNVVPVSGNLSRQRPEFKLAEQEQPSIEELNRTAAEFQAPKAPPDEQPPPSDPN